MLYGTTLLSLEQIPSHHARSSPHYAALPTISLSTPHWRTARPSWTSLSFALALSRWLPTSARCQLAQHSLAWNSRTSALPPTPPWRPVSTCAPFRRQQHAHSRAGHAAGSVWTRLDHGVSVPAYVGPCSIAATCAVVNKVNTGTVVAVQVCSPTCAAGILFLLGLVSSPDGSRFSHHFSLRP